MTGYPKVLGHTQFRISNFYKGTMKLIVLETMMCDNKKLTLNVE